MPNYQYDVFLSHNSKDKPAVEWLAAKLEDKAKLKVFLDIWNLIPGDPWQEDLENALDASCTVAVFLGPAGISGWHNEELRDAINTRVRNPERRVVPVLLPGTAMPQDDEIPNFLQRLTWVDFRAGLDDEEAFRRLVAGVRGQAPGRSGDVEPHRPPPQLAEVQKNIEEEKNMDESKVNTGGGAYVGGSVNTGGGDFVGRDKTVTAERGGVVIGGNVTGSTIVTGNNNVVGSTVNLQEQYIQHVYEAIVARENTSAYEKDDLKNKFKEIQAEDEKGTEADQGLIAYQLENIQKMAPDILDVALTTMVNPLAGFGMVAKKVAEKMKAEVG